MNIKLAETSEEREQVFRLRYRVYVDEMGLDPHEADHERRWIHDELDETGWILAAYSGDEVVGTVRTNLASKSGLGEWRRLLGMDQLGHFFPERVSMTTRLVVTREHRHGSLGIRLSKATFRLQYRQGTRFDTICCHPRQLGLFHRMGYRQVLPNIDLEGYGESLPLLLSMADAEHFARVGSPFLSELPSPVEDFGSVAFFHQSIAQQVYHEADARRPCLEKALPLTQAAAL